MSLTRMVACFTPSDSTSFLDSLPSRDQILMLGLLFILNRYLIP